MAESKRREHFRNFTTESGQLLQSGLEALAKGHMERLQKSQAIKNTAEAFISGGETPETAYKLAHAPEHVQKQHFANKKYVAEQEFKERTHKENFEAKERHHKEIIESNEAKRAVKEQEKLAAEQKAKEPTAEYLKKQKEKRVVLHMFNKDWEDVKGQILKGGTTSNIGYSEKLWGNSNAAKLFQAGLLKLIPRNATDRQAAEIKALLPKPGDSTSLQAEKMEAIKAVVTRIQKGDEEEALEANAEQNLQGAPGQENQVVQQAPNEEAVQPQQGELQGQPTDNVMVPGQKTPIQAPAAEQTVARQWGLKPEETNLEQGVRNVVSGLNNAASLPWNITKAGVWVGKSFLSIFDEDSPRVKNLEKFLSDPDSRMPDGKPLDAQDREEFNDVLKKLKEAEHSPGVVEAGMLQADKWLGDIQDKIFGKGYLHKDEGSVDELTQDLVGAAALSVMTGRPLSAAYQAGKYALQGNMIKQGIKYVGGPEVVQNIGKIAGPLLLNSLNPDRLSKIVTKALRGESKIITQLAGNTNLNLSTVEEAMEQVGSKLIPSQNAAAAEIQRVINGVDKLSKLPNFVTKIETLKLRHPEKVYKPIWDAVDELIESAKENYPAWGKSYDMYTGLEKSFEATEGAKTFRQSLGDLNSIPSFSAGAVRIIKAIFDQPKSKTAHALVNLSKVDFRRTMGFIGDLLHAATTSNLPLFTTIANQLADIIK